MQDVLLLQLKNTPFSVYISYLVIYLPAGYFMNQFGKWMKIACFRHWWQVLTCYGFYMIPISIWIKGMSFHMQYLWGLLAMCVLEFLGYALGTSKALGLTERPGVVYIEGNILVRLFNIKNFSLSMAMFFALYFPFGNDLATSAHRLLFP